MVAKIIKKKKKNNLRIYRLGLSSKTQISSVNISILHICSTRCNSPDILDLNENALRFGSLPYCVD